MRINTLSLKKNSIFLLLLFVLLLFPCTTFAYDFNGWYHGASDYQEVVDEATNEEKPLILYFHTEKCRWSIKMNNDYLAANEVEHFINTIPKVEINPGKGPNEKKISEEYGVKGFPSFFVYFPAFNSKPGKKVHPFRKNTDLTINKFLEAIKVEITHQYNNQGYLYFKKKKYDDALRYLDMAINYNQNNDYSYYLKGKVKYIIGYSNKDTAFLEDAQYCYLKALYINPNNQECKKDLKQLKKLMESLGI